MIYMAVTGFGTGGKQMLRCAQHGTSKEFDPSREFMTPANVLRCGGVERMIAIGFLDWTAAQGCQ